MKKLLIGGSPCTHWSIVRQKKKTKDGLREDTAEGLGWELFLNYAIALEKFKPDFFLYENNESASKNIQRQIEKILEIKLLHFDSSLVSAQNRKRIYATNVKVEPPEDKEIKLKDVLEKDVQPIAVYRPRFSETKCRIYTSGKSPTITAAGGGEHMPRFLLNGYEVKDITVERYKQVTRTAKTVEIERLQTMPEGYTKCLSMTRANNCLGNGWTAEMIIHIMQSWNIPKDEPLIVLSLYDGIATGRYCLEKMGYENIVYYAYEIDKYAVKCAMDNYPDIIQCGDAFQVRETGWEVKV